VVFSREASETRRVDQRPPGIYLKALRRAATLAGGKAELQARLEVPMRQLEALLDGSLEPPLEVFLKAVDILSTPPKAKPALASLRLRGLYAALETALAASGAERGNIQVAGPEGLEIAAHAGFSQPFLDFFARVADGGSACGAALKRGARVIVPDVERDPVFEGTPARGVMLDAGARAVQSTPLIGRGGRLLGMLSTHYERPYAPSEDELAALDRVAADAAMWLENDSAIA
jgi:GAF domain-containing protein